MDALSIPIFVAVVLTLILPGFVAGTEHARAQAEKVPAFPWNPSQHLRLYAYAFGGEACRAGGAGERALLLAYRIALLIAFLGCGLLFVASVSVE